MSKTFPSHESYLALGYTPFVKVLTFNTWLLESPFFQLNIAKDIQWRLKQLPFLLKESGADIIFLQEVWKPKFKKFLQQEMKKLGYYASFVHTGKSITLGNGLMILSRFPFKNRCELHTFKKFTRFDESFCQKGVLTNVIEHPKLGDVTLANAHIGSENFNPGKGTNSLHLKRQVNQKKEMILFLKRIMGRTSHFIFGADLNIHDHPWDKDKKTFDQSKYQYGYELTLNDLNLLDSYRVVHSNQSDKHYSCETYSSKNTYTKGLSNFGFSLDERVDYIFTHEKSGFEIVNSQIIFQESLAPDKLLSDHYGVMTELGY